MEDAQLLMKQIVMCAYVIEVGEKKVVMFVNLIGNALIKVQILVASLTSAFVQKLSWIPKTCVGTDC